MSNDIFNSKELLSNEENISQAFSKDSVKRVDLVISLFEMINSPSFDISSIAIDGHWGSGKTFFIKMLIMLINAKAGKSDLKEEYKKVILDTAQEKKKQITESIITPIYYDSWQNDSMSEPVLSLIYTICKQTQTAAEFSSEIEKIVKSMTKGISNFLLKILEKYALLPGLTDFKEAICKAFNSDSPFVSVIDTEELSKNIRNLLNEIVKDKSLVIFIDELDRCKPPFAIKLLESIKHYFYNEKILFVFSVNLDELQHSVKCVYGQNFDACRYLDRFFNVRFNLPPVDVRSYLKQEFSSNNKEDIALTITASLAREYKLELREICKFRAQVSLITKNINFNIYDSCEAAVEFIKLIFAPIALCLKFVDLEQYNDFMSGKGQEILKKLFTSNYIKDYCSLYLGIPKNSSDDKFCSTLIDSYNLLFNQEAKNRRIGSCEFDVHCGEVFFKIVGFFN